MQKPAEGSIVFGFLCFAVTPKQLIIGNRKTVIVDSKSGEVEEIGGIEHWAILPRYKQLRSGKPARIALTVFGTVVPVVEERREAENGETGPENKRESHEAPREREREKEREREREIPREAWGPPPVANHGPGFHKRRPQEQGEIRTSSQPWSSRHPAFCEVCTTRECLSGSH